MCVPHERVQLNVKLPSSETLASNVEFVETRLSVFVNCITRYNNHHNHSRKEGLATEATQSANPCFPAVLIESISHEFIKIVFSVCKKSTTSSAAEHKLS